MLTALEELPQKFSAFSSLTTGQLLGMEKGLKQHPSMRNGECLAAVMYELGKRVIKRMYVITVAESARDSLHLPPEIGLHGHYKTWAEVTEAVQFLQRKLIGSGWMLPGKEWGADRNRMDGPAPELDFACVHPDYRVTRMYRIDHIVSE